MSSHPLAVCTAEVAVHPSPANHRAACFDVGLVRQQAKAKAAAEAKEKKQAEDAAAAKAAKAKAATDEVRFRALFTTLPGRCRPPLPVVPAHIHTKRCFHTKLTVS